MYRVSSEVLEYILLLQSVQKSDTIDLQKSIHSHNFFRASFSQPPFHVCTLSRVFLDIPDWSGISFLAAPVALQSTPVIKSAGF